MKSTDETIDEIKEEIVDLLQYCLEGSYKEMKYDIDTILMGLDNIKNIKKCECQ